MSPLVLFLLKLWVTAIVSTACFQAFMGEMAGAYRGSGNAWFSFGVRAAFWALSVWVVWL